MNSNLLLSGLITALIILVGLRCSGQIEDEKSVTIVIDAGHGGKDPGKVAGASHYKHEKHINLSIALKLGNLLETNTKGLNVIYTRKTDEFISLPKRVEIANKANAVLFISIHCNSNPNRHITGTRTHIHDHHAKEPRHLANSFETWFTKRGLKSRGVQSTHDRGYSLYVLENTKMTAILTEVGFLTNPSEEKYLNTNIGQDNVAESIYNSVFYFLQKNHSVQLKSQGPYYRVQIMASSKKMELNHPFFAELGQVPVVEDPVNSNRVKFKYYAGRYKTQEQAETAAVFFQKKGYKGAFVVKLDE